MAELFANLDYIAIIKAVLLLIVGGVVTYIKTNPKVMLEIAEAEKWLETVKGAAAAYIDRAEKEFKGQGRGEAKFIWVVNTLHNLIPSKVRPFIPKETIEDIVQSTFDIVEDYAKQQLDSIVDKAIPDKGV